MPNYNLPFTGTEVKTILENASNKVVTTEFYTHASTDLTLSTDTSYAVYEPGVGTHVYINLFFSPPNGLKSYHAYVLGAIPDIYCPLQRACLSVYVSYSTADINNTSAYITPTGSVVLVLHGNSGDGVSTSASNATITGSYFLPDTGTMWKYGDIPHITEKGCPSAQLGRDGSTTTTTVGPTITKLSLPVSPNVTAKTDFFTVEAGKITCKRKGQVLVSAQLYNQSSSTAGYVAAYVYKNNAECADARLYSTATGVMSFPGLTFVEDVNAGDYFDLRARSIGNASWYIGNRSTYLSVTYLDY